MATSPRLQRSPLCNDQLLTHTVAITGETAKHIKDILAFHANFIASKIAAGACEAVRIKKFGTFRPQMDQIVDNGHSRPLYTQRKRGGHTTSPLREGGDNALI